MFTRNDSLQSLASTWARILAELWAWFTRILSECGGGRVRKSPARLRQHREVSYSPIRVGNKGKLQVANLKVCVQWTFIMREIDERMSTSALTVGRLAHPFLVTRPSDRREVIKIGSRGRCHCLHSLQHPRATEVWACVRRVVSLLRTEVGLPLLPNPPPTNPLITTLSSSPLIQDSSVMTSATDLRPILTCNLCSKHIEGHLFGSDYTCRSGQLDCRRVGPLFRSFATLLTLPQKRTRTIGQVG